MRVNTPESSASINPTEREPATNKPPLPQGEGWGEGDTNPTPTTPNTADTATAGHSRAVANPAEQDKAGQNKSLPPRRGKARACPEPVEGMGVNTPESSASINPTEREPAANKPPLPQGEDWGEGDTHPTPTTHNTADTAIAGHSRAVANPAEQDKAGQNKSLPPRRGKARMGVKSPESSASINPTEREPAANKPPLPQGEGWGEGESHPTHTTPNTTDNIPSIPSIHVNSLRRRDPDYLIEPLDPVKQAIFDYNSRIESGEYEARRNHSSTNPPPKTGRHTKLALAQITEN